MEVVEDVVVVDDGELFPAEVEDVVAGNVLGPSVSPDEESEEGEVVELFSEAPPELSSDEPSASVAEPESVEEVDAVEDVDAVEEVEDMGVSSPPTSAIVSSPATRSFDRSFRPLPFFSFLRSCRFESLSCFGSLRPDSSLSARTRRAGRSSAASTSVVVVCARVVFVGSSGPAPALRSTDGPFDAQDVATRSTEARTRTSCRTGNPRLPVDFPSVRPHSDALDRGVSDLVGQIMFVTIASDRRRTPFSPKPAKSSRRSIHCKAEH